MPTDPLFHYKELTTNVLDLLSFTLVAPELISLVRPTIKALVVRAVVFTLTILAIAPGVLLMIWLQSNGAGTILLIAIFIGTLTVGTVVVVQILSRYERKLLEMSEPLAARAFYIGLGVFCVSRLIAFAYSFHKLMVHN
jgi:hypothetical protein